MLIGVRGGWRLLGVNKIMLWWAGWAGEGGNENATDCVHYRKEVIHVHVTLPFRQLLASYMPITAGVISENTAYCIISTERFAPSPHGATMKTAVAQYPHALLFPPV